MTHENEPADFVVCTQHMTSACCTRRAPWVETAHANVGIDPWCRRTHRLITWSAHCNSAFA
eukprot:6923257-Pyramimonas_sp.AAC.1